MGIPPSPPIINVLRVKREYPFGVSSFLVKREDVVGSDSNVIYNYRAMIRGRSRVKPGGTLPTLIMLMTGGPPSRGGVPPLNRIMLTEGGVTLGTPRPPGTGLHMQVCHPPFLHALAALPLPLARNLFIYLLSIPHHGTEHKNAG